MPPKKRKKATVKQVTAAALARGGGSGEKKFKEKWKTKSVGGSDLSWDPYGEKTLVRYATEAEHKEFERTKRYSVVNYGGSREKAIWFATVGGQYDAGFASARPWRVNVQVLVNQETPLINFESSGFKGEAAHPDEVIVKENERGAYGIGRNMIDQLKPTWESNDDG